MAKFRNKPVVIDAVRFDPKSKQWPECIKPWNTMETPYQPRDMSWGYVETPEGKIHVLAGDWIITHENGEIYICKNSIFKKTYEPAE